MILDIARYFLAAELLLYGVDGFLHFLPPPSVDPRMQNFGQQMNDAKFILPTVKVMEIICGLFFLFHFYVELALVTIFPIVFGIIVSQLIFNCKKGLLIVSCISVPYIVVLTSYWSEFSVFFFHAN